MLPSESVAINQQIINVILLSDGCMGFVTRFDQKKMLSGHQITDIIVSSVDPLLEYRDHVRADCGVFYSQYEKLIH